MPAPPDRTAPLPAVSRFRDNQHYVSALVTDPPVGSTAMTRILVLRFTTGFPPTGVLWGHANSIGSSDGWQLRWRGPANNDFQIQINDGGAVLRSASFVLSVGPLRRYVVMVATYNETELIVNVDGADGTPAGPFVGFTVSTAGGVTIGADSNGDAGAEGFAIACALASDTVALDAAGRAAAVLAVQRDLSQGRSILPAAGYDENYWDARDIPGLPVLTWADRIGAVDLIWQAPGIGAEVQGYPATF